MVKKARAAKPAKPAKPEIEEIEEDYESDSVHEDSVMDSSDGEDVAEKVNKKRSKEDTAEGKTKKSRKFDVEAKRFLKGKKDDDSSSSSSDDGDSEVSGLAEDEESAQEEDVMEESEDEGPRAPGSSFAAALARIKQKDIKDDGPILAKSKGAERKLEEAKLERKTAYEIRKMKRETLIKDHKPPIVPTDDRERAMVKVATKGVVRLFNAIKEAQKERDENADVSKVTGKKVLQVDKMSKNKFLEVLKEGGEKNAEKSGSLLKKSHKTDKAEGPDFLRDDFMMKGNKLKDWDKEGSEDESESAPVSESDDE